MIRVFWVIVIVCLAVWLLLPEVDSRPTSVPPLQPPSFSQVFGTDHLGRDVALRLLMGGRSTLVMTVSATLIAAGMGIICGLLAGFYGGWVDRIFQTALVALLALPNLILALAFVTVLGQGMTQITAAVAVAQIAPFTQFVRGSVQQLKHAAYVEGVYAVGASPYYILLRVILPNGLSLIGTYTVLTFGYCLMNIGALGFLGLVGDPSLAEWGKSLAEGREFLREAPWISLAPGIAIALLMLIVNFLATRLTHRE